MTDVLDFGVKMVLPCLKGKQGAPRECEVPWDSTGRFLLRGARSKGGALGPGLVRAARRRRVDRHGWEGDGESGVDGARRTGESV